jgi:ferredoxin
VTQDIYQELARFLDDLPGGFPKTESGVELRILRRLFTPEQAALAQKLSLIPEDARVIARRAGIPVQEAADRLEEMALQGLLFRMEKEGSLPRYRATQYVIGIWEFQLNRLDPDFVNDMNEYIPALFDGKTWEKAPQLRAIPVGESISPNLNVLSYERAEELVRSQTKFLEAPCICRREHKLVAEGCDKPEGACLVFGAGADYYHKNGLGRLIDLEETLSILKQADEAGLVLQPSNAQEIVNICCCCGCCCQVLKALKRYPKPAHLFSTPFLAELDRETCEGCGTCIDRCQMDALKMEEDVAALDPDHCIGCGLCVTTCPSDSLKLARKPEAEQSGVPKNMVEATLQLAKARGKLSNADLIQMQLKSKMDRLLASRS